MNTCMQCIISIPELVYYFYKKEYQKDLKSKKGNYACESFKSFIDTYSQSSRSERADSDLYSVCHSFLQPNRQHDCQEFLRRFFGKIQDEINGNTKYSFPDKVTYDKAWEIYKESNFSIIDNLFAGLMRSSVRCHKCKYRSGTIVILMIRYF